MFRGRKVSRGMLANSKTKFICVLWRRVAPDDSPSYPSTYTWRRDLKLDHLFFRFFRLCVEVAECESNTINDFWPATRSFRSFFTAEYTKYTERNLTRNKWPVVSDRKTPRGED
jgi:hypothetical protein